MTRALTLLFLSTLSGCVALDGLRPPMHDRMTREAVEWR